MTFLYDLSLLRGLATMAWLSNGRSGTESEKVTTASSEKSVNYRMNAKNTGHVSLEFGYFQQQWHFSLKLFLELLDYFATTRRSSPVVST